MKKFSIISLFLLLTFHFPLSTFHLISSSPAQAKAEEKDVGVVVAVEGKVMIYPGATEEGEPAERGQKVYLYDEVATSEESKIKIFFHDDSLLSLGPSTTMSIDEFLYSSREDIRSSTFTVLEGKLKVLVGRVFSGKGSKYQVKTATAVAGIRGTYFLVNCPHAELTEVFVLEGSVVVKNIMDMLKKEVVVGAGLTTTIGQAQIPLIPFRIPEAKLNKILKETEITEEVSSEQIEAEAQPRVKVKVEEEGKPFVTAEEILEGKKETRLEQEIQEREKGTVPVVPEIRQEPPTTPVNIKITFPE